MSMLKLVSFDLDGTLTESKAPMTSEMGQRLCRLLDKFLVAVISGGSFGQFEKQFIGFFQCSKEKFCNLFLLPTNGSAMYRFNGDKWVALYAELLTVDERKRIFDAFRLAFKETAFVPEKKIYGDLIEDRGTQVTFSGLGQLAPVELKKKWDPDRSKRMKIKKRLDFYLPDLEIRVNSSSSIDITRKGIDKGYGMTRCLEYLKLTPSEAIFFGDGLFPGGNDEAVIRTGIKTIAVSGPSEAAAHIDKLLTGNLFSFVQGF